MNYLDPNVLARVKALELRARQVVEGMMAGTHASPRHGFAVEFAHHREYVPGDDIKHLDWKVFARSERYYLKQYELETDLTCWLIIDGSGSMRYASGEINKYDYSSVLAATLAHIVLREGDRAGVVVADSEPQRFLRSSGAGSQLQEIIRQLVLGPTGKPSRIGAALTEVAGRLPRRGLVFIFSDFFDDVAELLQGLRRLRFDRHELIAVTVLDPAEVDFPFSSATLFKGLELPEHLLTDPRSLRLAYLEELNGHREQFRRGCRDLGVELFDVRTDTDPGLALARFLAER